VNFSIEVYAPTGAAEWLKFWAEVVKALAWPITLLVLAVFFHRPLKNLFERLASWKGLGIEASFGDRVGALAVDSAKAAENVDPATAPATGHAPTLQTNPVDAPATGKTGDTSNAAEISSADQLDLLTRVARSTHHEPDITRLAGSILMAWLGIEAELNRLVTRFGLDNSRLTVRGQVSALRDLGKISRQTATLIHRAMTLRSEVLHGRVTTLSTADVLAYEEGARSIVELLKKAA